MRGGAGILQWGLIIIIDELSRERARMKVSGVLDELKCNPGDPKKASNARLPTFLGASARSIGQTGVPLQG